jgi:hypothetical protein
MKRVRVTQLAFANGTRVRPGDVLTVADTFKASWAEDVPVPAKVEPALPVEEKQARKPRVKAPDFSGDLAQVPDFSGDLV